MMAWPEDLYELVFMPHTNEKLDDLAGAAEPEEWDYRHTATDHHKPILYNYVRYTYRRLAEEDKIVVADDGSAIAFNTGLVTAAQGPIFCYCTQNRLQDRPQPWHFHAWRRQGEYDLTRFSTLPDMAHYFDDPSQLVLDIRKELPLARIVWALQVTARLTIREGKLEEFKVLAAQCMRVVRDRDSGTLQYDWFFNDDQTECVVRETYRDSAAVLEHVANLGPALGAILGVCDMVLEIYGSPSDQLVKATVGLAPKIYSPFQTI